MSIKLSQLLNGFAIIDQDFEISGITLDSRTANAGFAFIALDGSNQHGLSHADQAIANGAAVIVYENSVQANHLAAAIKTVPVIAVAGLAEKLGEIAARFYEQPSQHLSVIGITGTNGKTSCSQFLGQALDHCGIIGTLGWGTWGSLKQTVNTTPDAIAVQRMLAELLNQGNSSVAMEVSSHGLHQGRVNNVQFKGAVYTNISRDHLDYHGNMDDYLQAKLQLLNSPGLEFVVINADDAYSEQIIAAVPQSVRIWLVSTKNVANNIGEQVLAKNIQQQMQGIAFDACWNGSQQAITVPVFGEFNIENSLLVLAVMLAMGMSLQDAATRLAKIKPVTGRMECFGGINAPLVFVDYAHTPDALDKVLGGLKKHCQQNLWVVFGCGGNRDAGKRPQMGASAEKWADHVLITDDNPRFESAQDIVKDILTGCRSDKVRVVQDRKMAIRQAVNDADAGDVVVIAGKGHEQYQEIKGVQLPFSDSSCVIEALAMRA
jgi:UDP-N-acetylmuramoyl-L-alanyl-D-glutamate--2,6-diaminopimelate ligase